MALFCGGGGLLQGGKVRKTYQFPTATTRLHFCSAAKHCFWCRRAVKKQDI